MRAGVGRYDRVPIYFEPTLLPPEVWVDVTELMVPGIKPYYMISNYGRVYHKYAGTILSENIDSKGYLYKPLATINGSVNVRIHRLVMMGFCYFPGCEELLVNHKDGNKTHPWLWNLEWVNYSENAIHAVQNNLIGPRVEDEKVHEVCRLLENPNNTLQSISMVTGVSYTAVQAIQGKRSHTDISDQYNIQSRKVGQNLTNEQVHEICKYFATIPKGDTTQIDHCRNALISIGVPVTSRTVKTVKKIYTRETYTYISKDYNF